MYSSEELFMIRSRVLGPISCISQSRIFYESRFAHSSSTRRKEDISQEILLSKIVERFASL